MTSSFEYQSLKKMKYIAVLKKISMIAAFGGFCTLAGCERESGLEEAADEVGDAIEDAADEIEDASE